MFARKLIRAFAATTEEDIQNEVKVIAKICTSGHPNIINVLDHGPLGSFGFYFIDMELCDVNLHDYINGKRAEKWIKEPLFVVQSCSSMLRMRNLWTIMRHIANGLEFIHENGYVHRDMKPNNGNSISVGMRTNVSPLFSLSASMENCRLWGFFTSDLKKGGDYAFFSGNWRISCPGTHQR